MYTVHSACQLITFPIADRPCDSVLILGPSTGFTHSENLLHFVNEELDESKSSDEIIQSERKSIRDYIFQDN